MEQQLQPKAHKMVILAEGSFGILESKTATVLVRYHTQNVVAVIDSTKAGKDVSDVIGVGGGISIVSSLAEAMKFQPTMLALGIAPRIGQAAKTRRQLDQRQRSLDGRRPRSRYRLLPDGLELLQTEVEPVEL